MRYPLWGCEDGDVLDGGFDWLDPADGGVTPHPGLDLNAGYGGDADRGLRILSVSGGYVRFIQQWDGRTAGYGTHVWVEHDDGHWVHHAHLETFLVQLDQRVERGDNLARCGKSGWQAWAHDHVEVTRTKPQNFNQWPRGWSRAQVEAVYCNPHDYFTVKEQEAANVTDTERQAMQGEIDSRDGIISELGGQVESLRWLLGLAQGERDAIGTEAERLRAEVEAGTQLSPEDAAKLAKYDRIRELVTAS